MENSIMITLTILLLVIFSMRVYFFEKSLGENATNIFISILTQFAPFKYFFANKILHSDSPEISRYKNISNYFLYIFYAFFVLVMIYTAIVIFVKIV